MLTPAAKVNDAVQKKSQSDSPLYAPLYAPLNAPLSHGAIRGVRRAERGIGCREAPVAMLIQSLR